MRLGSISMVILLHKLPQVVCVIGAYQLAAIESDTWWWFLATAIILAVYDAVITNEARSIRAVETPHE